MNRKKNNYFFGLSEPIEEILTITGIYEKREIIKLKTNSNMLCDIFHTICSMSASFNLMMITTDNKVLLLERSNSFHFSKVVKDLKCNKINFNLFNSLYTSEIEKIRQIFFDFLPLPSKDDHKIICSEGSSVPSQLGRSLSQDRDLWNFKFRVGALYQKNNISNFKNINHSWRRHSQNAQNSRDSKRDDAKPAARAAWSSTAKPSRDTPKACRSASLGEFCSEQSVLRLNKVRDNKIYIFPGGHCAYNESIINALLRELQEETCIKLNMQDLLFHQSCIFNVLIYDFIIKKLFDNFVFPVKINMSSLDIIQNFKETQHTRNPIFINISDCKNLFEAFVQIQKFMLL